MQRRTLCQMQCEGKQTIAMILEQKYVVTTPLSRMWVSIPAAEKREEVVKRKFDVGGWERRKTHGDLCVHRNQNSPQRATLCVEPPLGQPTTICPLRMAA